MRTPHHWPTPPLTGLLLLLLTLAPTPARAAAWTYGGYPVFNTTRDEEVAYQDQMPRGTVVCPDGAGGLIAACVFRVDSIRVQRLDQATGQPLWNGNAGLVVNPGGNLNTNGQVKVMSDLHGGAWIAWPDTRAGTPGVYVQRVDANGVFQLTAGGKRFGTFASDFDIDVASTGALLLAYGDGGVRAQRIALDGTEQWAAGGVLLASGDIPLNLDITNLGDGAVLSWNAARVISAVSRIGVFANRVTTAGAVLWGANGVTLYHNAVTSASLASHAYSTLSQLVVTWMVADTIRAQKLSISGVTQWGANGVSVFTRLNTAWDDPLVPFNLKIVPSGSGAILGWVDGRDSNRPGPNGFNHAQDLYAQRLGSTGTLLWGATGAPIDTATGTQRSPRMESDGADGVYVVYVDLFFTTVLGQDDIGAAHLDLNGVRTWRQSVTGTSPGDGVQDEPVLTIDPVTGILVAWTDRRDDATKGRDLYAQHLAADGSRFNPTLTVTSPNGGESLRAFTPTTVTWTSSQLPAGASVSIAYNVGGGARQTLIASTPNDGSEVVNLPAITTSQLRIHVADAASGTPADSSNAFVSLCASIASGSSQSNSFGAPSDFASGDLDGDGIADLVMSSGGGVSRQLGLGSGGVGNGQFGAPTFLTNQPAYDIALEDVDEDGILDLLTIETAAMTVQLRHGRGAAGVGDGTFDPPVTVLNVASTRFAVGDVNSDGILDFVTSNALVPGGRVVLGQGGDGQGNGTFAAPVPVTIPDQAVELALADLNNDGALDIVALNDAVLQSVDSLVVMLGVRPPGSTGTGSGTFSRQVTMPLTKGWNDFVVANINEDSFLDLVLARADSVLYLRGNGAGSFLAGVRSAGGGDQIAVCDVDEDSRADLIATSNTSNLLTFLYGNGTGATGNGTFTAVPGPTLTGTGAFGIVVGDFDENGSPDAGLGTLGGATARTDVRLNGCAPTLPTDLTVTGPAAGATFQLRAGNTATIGWTKGASVIAVDVAISHDGGAHWETVGRNLYGTTFLWPVSGPLSSHMRARVTDSFVPTRFDASDADFVLCTAVAVTDSVAGPADARAAVSADFNEDGRADLAVATGTGVSVQLRTPAGGLGAAATFGAGLVANGITAADFDEDGILDLAIATPTGVATLRGLGKRRGG